MKIKTEYRTYTLHFKFPAGTSRGIMNDKLTYFLKVSDPGNPEKVGYGEVPFFKGLSAESQAELESQLDLISGMDNLEEMLESPLFSSLRFGLEMALRDLEGGGRSLYFPSPFTLAESSLEINGLIWMGDFNLMKSRVEEKLKADFKCIKIKIGAVNWNDELDLIRFIRSRRGKHITVRVDANGAFSPDEAMPKLEELARLGVHSIEQPIKHGNWENMRFICEHSPVPVALDEDLIGVPVGIQRDELIDYIRPQFLILKPALCYGFSGASDWIERARRRNIGWWVTSALESSSGLNAIAQFTGVLHPEIPQGLGTGSLYTNNLPSPLRLEGDRLWYCGPADAYKSRLDSLFK